MTSPADEPIQYPVVSLKVDWQRTNYIGTYDTLTGVLTGITIERSITGDLPTEAGLVEGYAATSLSATLKGKFSDDRDTLDAFAPYRSDSPLYTATTIGSPVTCDMAMRSATGTALVRQFTGQIRELRADAAERTVHIEALDAADRLREPITLPQFGMTKFDITHPVKNYKFFIRTQGIIDYVLRRNGIYASPPAHPTAQLSITGHGWLVAETGRSSIIVGNSTPIPEDTWWVPGPTQWGMLAVRGVWTSSTGHSAQMSCYTREHYSVTAGNGLGFGIWMRVGNDMPDVTIGERKPIIQFLPYGSGGGISMAVYLSTLNVVPEIHPVIFPPTGGELGSPVTITVPTQWMYVGVHFQHNTNGTTSIRVRMNGTTILADNSSTPSPIKSPRHQMWCLVHTHADWSNLHVWYDPNPPSGDWPGEFHTPQAALDPGLNRLTHLPDVLNEDSWQVIKDAAGAEYGLAGFDQNGFFRFTQRSVTDPSVVDKTITSDRALLDLGTTTSTDALRNIITTETTAAYMVRFQTIYETRDVQDFETPPGVSVYEVSLPHGVMDEVDLQLGQVASEDWKPERTHGFVTVAAQSPTVEIAPGLVSGTFSMTGHRAGRVEIRNNATTTVRFATPAGQPAFRLAGYKLIEEPVATEEIRNTGSVTQVGARLFAIPASPYRQILEPLRPVATGLLNYLCNPLPVIDTVEVIGDPTTAVGDIVRLTDPRGHGSFRAVVVKTVRTFSEGKLVDRLTVRPIAPPRVGISDDAELGLADSTLVAAP